MKGAQSTPSPLRKKAFHEAFLLRATGRGGIKRKLASERKREAQQVRTEKYRNRLVSPYNIKDKKRKKITLVLLSGPDRILLPHPACKRKKKRWKTETRNVGN